MLGLAIATAAGWGVIAAGLQRGLTGRARTAALTAHGVTPFAALLSCPIFGLGFLYTLIALTAQWWALALITRLRPERLVAPAADGLRWLAAWLAMSAALAYTLVALIF